MMPVTAPARRLCVRDLTPIVGNRPDFQVTAPARRLSVRDGVIGFFCLTGRLGYSACAEA